MLKFILALAVVTGGNDFEQDYPALVGASSENRVLLWKFLEAATGKPVEPHLQSNNVGDCVAQAFGMGVDLLAASEIYLLGENERWFAKSSVEMIYAGSRNEIGGSAFKGQPGSEGKWAAEYLKQYGVLHRTKYDTLDLTVYSSIRSKQYRDLGVPDELEPIAREHPVMHYTKVADFDSACDAMAGGQPVIICSSYAPVDGKNSRRDEDGFIKLDTGNGRWCLQCRKWHSKRTKWYHAWCMIGFDKESDRPGAYIISSHGTDWITGPRPHGLPEGAFKLSPEHFNLMVQDWNDSYAISAYVGHPGKRVDRLRKHRLYQ